MNSVYRHMTVGLLVFFAFVGVALIIDSPTPGLLGFIAFCLISSWGMDKYIKACRKRAELEELASKFE